MKAAESPRRHIWFWLGLSAIAGIVLTALWAVHLERRSLAAMRHADDLAVSTEEVLASTTEAENGAYEYIVTKEARYLKASNAARQELDLETDRLSRLVQNDPKARVEAEKLRLLIQKVIDNLSQIARAGESGHLDARRAMDLTEQSQRLLDDTSRILSRMKIQEQSALARFAHGHQRRMRGALAGLGGSTLLAFCCLLLGKTVLSRTASRRQRAEEGLSVSERRFQALCEQAPLGIYETDARGTCVYTNSRWSEMSGLSGPESLGHGWKRALHPDDRSFQGWERAMLRGARWEYRLVTPRGETRWIRALGGPIYSDKGEITGYVGTLEDVTERKQAETALEEREALKRAILNSLLANIAVIRADGTIREANDAWLRSTRTKGEPPACWVEMGANYLAACREAAEAGSADARKALTGIQDVLAGKLESFEMEYLTELREGKRWFYLLVNPLVGVWAGGAVITQVDITDRKRAGGWFRLAVEAAPSGMLMSDTDGKIVLVNSRAEKLFGYSREELLGQPVEILVPERLREGHVALRRSFYQRPEVREIGKERDLYARRKDGTQFLVEIGLNPIETGEGISVLSSIMDITEKRHAEDERQKFVSLADQSLEFVGMYDLNLKPFYVNSAGLRLVGVHDLEAARQARFEDHFFPEDQPFILNEFVPRLRREGYGKVEIRLRHFQTGEAIWMLYNMFGIYDSRGGHVGWGTVSIDVTERKRAEEALRENRQELRALAGRLINAEELERKRISRELHDDLSQKLALLAFDAGGLLVTPPPSADKVQAQLFSLRARIFQLTDEVRQISHELHPSILEDLGLTAALRDLCEEFSAREGIEVLFTQDGASEGLPVEVASCLYRVAQEALHNVLKHARTGYVRVKVDGNGNGIHLVVRDTGVGFDAEAVLRRPGLGIVSMKERVRLVQGTFEIHSKPGQGTEVKVFVPLPKVA